MPAAQTDIKICGVRHHGPGSAYSLHVLLRSYRPTMLLVEGPPEADDIATDIVRENIEYPIALMVHQVGRTDRGLCYPFAEYSPELQAIYYAEIYDIPLRFMDLPVTHLMAMMDEEQTDLNEFLARQRLNPETASPDILAIQQDPLGTLAHAAGFPDGERWWEHLIERRGKPEDVFPAILEAMQALRDEVADAIDDLTMLREAYMRRIIREALKTEPERLLIVCGAWHAPALHTMPPASHDNALLKGLRKEKVNAVWIPWTQGRLGSVNGYGAGILAPGWYEHIWRTPVEDITQNWMVKVTKSLRKFDVEASSAQAIDAIRMAETLAAMRGYTTPGLDELNEAALSVFCMGDDELLQRALMPLLHGEKIGRLPENMAVTPLMCDIQQEQKRLRLKPKPEPTELRLNLREARHREKSQFLYRLLLLDIPWGYPYPVENQKGTFNERWELNWEPIVEVKIIDASVWGNALYEAATNRVHAELQQADSLPELLEWLQKVLVANLPESVHDALEQIQARVALAADILEMLSILPELINIAQYGDVRAYDAELLIVVVDQLVKRVCVGLSTAVLNLDDDTATAYFKHIQAVDAALRAMNRNLDGWHAALGRTLDEDRVHAKLRGYACRILHEADILDVEDVTIYLNGALAPIQEPFAMASWLEGFLSGSGLLLLHQDQLLWLLSDWVTQLKEETFILILPLLRRTFTELPPNERAQIGERILHGQPATTNSLTNDPHFDQQRADDSLAIIRELLGWSSPSA
ncbi:MAG: DUF5682 family protein [Anaerolineales bacterium]